MYLRVFTFITVFLNSSQILSWTFSTPHIYVVYGNFTLAHLRIIKEDQTSASPNIFVNSHLYAISRMILASVYLVCLNSLSV